MITDLFDSNLECPTMYRHKRFIVPPSMLTKMGIEFTKVIQNPGELIFTLYGAYHWGFNSGFNVCESTNLASPLFKSVHESARICPIECSYGKATNKIHQNLGMLLQRFDASKISVNPNNQMDKVLSTGSVSKNCPINPLEDTSVSVIQTEIEEEIEVEIFDGDNELNALLSTGSDLNNCVNGALQVTSVKEVEVEETFEAQIDSMNNKDVATESTSSQQSIQLNMCPVPNELRCDSIVPQSRYTAVGIVYLNHTTHTI